MISVNKKKHKRTTEDYIIDSVIWIVMIIVVIVTLYPFYYCVVQAFNSGVDSTLGGVYFFPRVPTLENFITLLSDGSWGKAIIISVMRTLIGTLLGVFVTSILAYALSFEHVLFRSTYYKIYIFTMYFSGGMIPFYILLKNVHLINTFWVYVIPGMLNVYYILIMINFFQTIPSSLYESARLDGANDFIIFVRIALPLSKASLATVALFFAVGQWNSWIDSVYYVTRDHLRPMAYLMMQIINKSLISSNLDAQSAAYAASAQQSTTTSLQMAAMVLAVVPILVVYPFLQKYFVKGVMIGAVKE